MNLNGINFEYVLMGLLSFIVAGSIHEYGHAFTAYMLGDTTARANGRLTLNPLAHIDIWGTIFFPFFAAISGFPVLGWMKPVPVNPHNFKNPSRDHTICALAGPVSNLLQASFIIIVIKIMKMMGPLSGLASSTIFIYIYSFFVIYFEINILLMVFNLLPFPPLDGGWILRHFLPDTLKEKYDKVSRFGFIILYLLIITNVFGAIFNPIINGVQALFDNLLNANILLAILPFIALVLLILYFFREELGPVVQRLKNSSTLHVLKGEKKDMAFQTPETVTKDSAFKLYVDEYEKESKARIVWKTCDKTVFSKQRSVCIKCDKYITCLARSLKEEPK